MNLLLIESDPRYAQALHAALLELRGAAWDLVHVETLTPAVQLLSEQPFDLVLVDLEGTSESLLEACRQLRAARAEAGLLLLASGPEQLPPDGDLERLGRVTCATRDRHEVDGLVRRLEELAGDSPASAGSSLASVAAGPSAVAASAGHATPPPPSLPGHQKQVAEPLSQAEKGEHRNAARYLLAKSVFAVPVLPNLDPDASFRVDSIAADISHDGIAFDLLDSRRLPGRLWVVGMEDQEGHPAFATAEMCHCQPVPGGLRLGARFVTGHRDVLRAENLTPFVDAQTHRFRTRLSSATIAKWVDLGIMLPTLLHRAYVCPECRGLPAFGSGCRMCGSVRLVNSQLIHHFACAYVGYVTEFVRDAEVICPKCHAGKLVIGADFENLDGPYQCLNCIHSDTELEHVGNCLQCGLRFPLRQAREEEIIGYHVNRLDPLALIDSA